MATVELKRTSKKRENKVIEKSELKEKVDSMEEQTFAKVAGFFMVEASAFFQKVLPYVILIWEKLDDLYSILAPYHIEYVLIIVIGFTMVFFGGVFMTLIAAVEAYRISCWEETQKQLKILQINFAAALQASREDDLIDANNDGIADVKQISKKELLTRKMHVFMTSVEPMQVTSAFGSLYIGFFAIVATLKLKFAFAITLGSSIGEVMYLHSAPFANPSLKLLLPEEYHKWAPVITSYFCKFVGVSIGWTIQRVLSAFHSAIRGIEILKYGVSRWLYASGFIEDCSSFDTFFADIVLLALACSGIMWQVSLAFGLPFPLNILLLPFRIIEWILMYFANIK